jgi:uncharacterized membrane protein
MAYPSFTLWRTPLFYPLAGTVAAVHQNRYAVNQLRCWRGKENGSSR